jgi:hypothetical protein
METQSQEIGEGVLLHKRVVASLQDFNVLDQTNVYTVR